MIKSLSSENISKTGFFMLDEVIRRNTILGSKVIEIEKELVSNMNANIDISVSEYDDTAVFVVVKRGNENLYMEMGICQFIDEMEYWGMPTKGGVLNGEAGYIFSKNINIFRFRLE